MFIIDCRPRPAYIVGSASDRVTTHALRDDDGRTLCGRDTLRGYHWKDARDGRKEDVDCRTCRKAIRHRRG